MNELDSIRWWHRIDLGDCITPGANYESDETLEKLNLPEDMSGLSVLDLGAWDGYYSFACEKRNAKRVQSSSDGSTGSQRAHSYWRQGWIA